MRQPPDPREDEDDGEEGNGMDPAPPLDQTLNDGTTNSSYLTSTSLRLLIIGIFAEVYFLDNHIVRKVPRSESEEDLQPTLRDALIHGVLGNHPRIAECLSQGISDYIEIKYYPRGDPVKYLDRNSIPPELRSKWYKQILEAIVFIHSRGVIHSDLALRQFLIDGNLDLRLGLKLKPSFSAECLTEKEPGLWGMTYRKRPLNDA
ncbi:hypothetical protein N7447_008800 [Penicillium robsamsonii]|uniref:uncharacterized protein n=1 Tax=Penicillium robsamsonii TaxID=1792511 RepID=UPI002547A534|nr:uncharacterized protein N7447_008800 [Penicillium robsamsonii]KAJ5816567.1 hypothetical protein N7447_008800 [Penicillium robsamsonii]